eukprot:scaffold797_cov408-Chaetoceros_neogracile.AAC.69
MLSAAPQSTHAQICQEEDCINQGIAKVNTMMFKVAFLSALCATVSADISSDSVVGKNLHSKARRVNQNYEEDLSWLTKYDMKFDSCHSIHSYGGEGQGGGEEGGTSTPFGTQLLVQYKLCPTSSNCRSCNGGGDYVVQLNEFVESYIEAKAEIEEQACQNVENNCNCDYYYGDDQACLTKCYATAGLTGCGDDDGNGDEFDVSEYLECKQAEFGYYNGKYLYIGPVCSNNGKSINLGVFEDAYCTVAAKSGTFEKYNYNYALPYSKSSIIGSGCIACKEQQDNNDNNDNNNNGDGNDDANNNNNNNQYYEQPEPTEFCQEIYEGAAKCEKNLTYKSAAYRDTGSCQYINKIVPSLERVYKSNGGSGGAAVGMAVFFGMTTFGATAAAYYFFTKAERTTVDLATQDGDAAFA